MKAKDVDLYDFVAEKAALPVYSPGEFLLNHEMSKRLEKRHGYRDARTELEREL